MSSSKAVAAKRKPAAKGAAGKAAAKSTTRKAASPKRPAPPALTVAGVGVGPQMTELAVIIEKALRADDLSAIPAEPLQQLIAAAAKAYSAKREAGEQFHPVSRAGRLTPTDIMVMANGLLRSGNLQIFELGMWQSWTGD
jgi:hypothetical protein